MSITDFDAFKTVRKLWGLDIACWAYYDRMAVLLPKLLRSKNRMENKRIRDSWNKVREIVLEPTKGDIKLERLVSQTIKYGVARSELVGNECKMVKRYSSWQSMVFAKKNGYINDGDLVVVRSAQNKIFAVGRPLMSNIGLDVDRISLPIHRFRLFWPWQVTFCHLLNLGVELRGNRQSFAHRLREVHLLDVGGYWIRGRRVPEILITAGIIKRACKVRCWGASPDWMVLGASCSAFPFGVFRLEDAKVTGGLEATVELRNGVETGWNLERMADQLMGWSHKILLGNAQRALERDTHELIIRGHNPSRLSGAQLSRGVHRRIAKRRGRLLTKRELDHIIVAPMPQRRISATGKLTA